jgi:hypothetical protein
MKYTIYFLCILCSCQSQLRTKKSTDHSKIEDQQLEKDLVGLIDTSKMTVEGRYRCPEGYHRIKPDYESFDEYLGKLNLKPSDYPVHLFDGTLKQSQWVACGVVDQDIGDQDLQQCADAVMRLRGEYLFANKMYDKIHFNFVADNQPHSFTSFSSDRSFRSFRNYMEKVFIYAGTKSLKPELKAVSNIRDIKAGDVFIQTGYPHGHAVIVLDVAQNKKGDKIFLLAQSYMPAQEIHVLINPNDKNDSPWYHAKEGPIYTPQWEFKSSDLRRFVD